MTVLCVACRECGALTTMEHADDHDGLCMSCSRRERPAVSPLPAPIDHDVAQAIGGGDDPIRAAIDREFILWGRSL